MMIICKEDDSSFEGENYDDAFFVDETSMGEPWSEFGKWFQSRFCKAPTIMDRLAGMREHRYAKFTNTDLESVKNALNEMDTHEDLENESLIRFLKDRIDKHLSTENW